MTPRKIPPKVINLSPAHESWRSINFYKSKAPGKQPTANYNLIDTMTDSHIFALRQFGGAGNGPAQMEGCIPKPNT